MRDLDPNGTVENQAAESVDEAVGTVEVEESTADTENTVLKEVAEVTEEVLVSVIQEVPKKRRVYTALIVANSVILVISLTVSLAALFLSLAKTELTIGQGELIVEGGVVNEMLGNMITNDLSKEIAKVGRLRIYGIKIQVVLYGVDAQSVENGEVSVKYSKVSDIRDSDSVNAEIVFVPQESLTEFAEDCRAVLEIMSKQDIVYNDIKFIAEDNFTKINTKVSGRTSMDLTVGEIIGNTFYFGEIVIPEATEEDIEDIEPPETPEVTEETGGETQSEETG